MRGLCLLAAASTACAAEATTPAGDQPAPAVRITAPHQGELFVRDVITGEGARIAPVSMAAETDEDAAVELWLDGEKISDSGTAQLDLERIGFFELEARAVAGGETIASTIIQFAVDNPRFETCGEWLDLYAIPYAPGPERQGVLDSVTVVPPIGGIDYRYLGDAELRADLSADCSLIVALAETVPILKRRGVVEVVDIGVYNYRCIGGGTPPDCPEGISQHAFAKAIDVAGYVTAEGDYLSVNDDWVIDPDTSATCGAETEDERDSFLHEIVCAQKAARIWNIALTPNFNAAHRNHFHLDLTADGDYIRRADPTEVDLGPDRH